MRRREFIAGLGGAAAAWPLSAQQLAMPMVGFLSSRAPGADPQLLSAFRRGLSEIGFTENRNVKIEFRWAAGHDERLPEFALGLVRQQASVLVAASGLASVRAAKASTSTIPIVFVLGADPVAIGLVDSLNRPGGNLTGIANLNIALVSKRLELLHEAVPSAGRIAVLVKTATPNADMIAETTRVAAHSLGLALEVVGIREKDDLDGAFASLRAAKVGALVIGTDASFISWSADLAALTIRHSIPTIFQFREFVAAGGLMSYAGSDTDTHRLLGNYTAESSKARSPLICLCSSPPKMS